VSIKGARPPFELPKITSETVSECANIQSDPLLINCFGFTQPVPLYQREKLQAGQKIKGPALILEKVSTTLLDTHWSCAVDDWGNLLLKRI